MELLNQRHQPGMEVQVLIGLTLQTGPISPAGANVIPDAGTDVTIPAGLTNYPTLTAAATCKSIVINWGGSLIDNGNLTLSSGNALTVQHEAISGGQWHLISSPVSGTVSGLFEDQYLRNFNTTSNSYEEIILTDIPLNTMQGYALWPVGSFSAPYVGGFNPASNNFTISGGGDGWNLVGNPYTSAINWDAASGWGKTGVDNAIYVMNGAGWRTYVNGLGIPSGVGPYIAPTQGFFVHSSVGGTLSMSNGVRVHNDVAFYKSSSVVVPNLVRIAVSGNGYTDEAVVRFLSEATPEFDGNYDAYKLYGDVPESAQLYTFGSVPLVINSLPETNTVNVGLRVGTSGAYTIASTEMNDLRYVTLEDSETGIFTDLTDNSYTFNAAPGDNEQRFKLHFSALSVNEKESVNANIYSYQNTVYVNMKDNVKGDVYIYNTAGQLIATKTFSKRNERIQPAELPVFIW